MKNLNKKYISNQILKYYASNRTTWMELYKSEREVIKKLKIAKNSKILDIGSACGGLGKILKKRYKIRNYTGVEINEQAHNLAKVLNKNFKFFNIDLLNYEKSSNFISKYNYVFSLGCIDWNVEFDKMLKKAWSHVIPNGSLLVTLRLTNNKTIKKKSFQFINFYKKLSGEKANYQILTLDDLNKKIMNLNVSKITHYGYWGRPNKTVKTQHKKLFFVAIALKKNTTNKNLIKKNLIKNIIT